MFNYEKELNINILYYNVNDHYDSQSKKFRVSVHEWHPVTSSVLCMHDIVTKLKILYKMDICR